MGVHIHPYQEVPMDITVEQLAQHVLDLRDEDRASLELAADVEADAFAAFASDYVAIVPPCTNCHVP
jgi:hypothetical protein